MALCTALRAFTLSKGGRLLLRYSPLVLRAVSMAITFTPATVFIFSRVDTGMMRETCASPVWTCVARTPPSGTNLTSAASSCTSPPQ